MSTMAPEFSRRVALAQLGAEPFRQRIEATAEERKKLSLRFDLVSLDHLVAEVVLRRQNPDSRAALLTMLESWNGCAREYLHRHYDPEVQGATWLRPGEGDAAVFLPAAFLPT